MLQAKCVFLKQGGEQFEAEDAFGAVTELEQELDGFANSHLSAGALPDDALLHFGQMVSTLSRILVSAHEVATEVPDWRPTLQKPPEGGLSVPFLKETVERIHERMKQIPMDINATRRLLPSGSWRKESDLRPEVYGFAALLYPNDPIHKIQVRDTLMYLDDDQDCRLRKIQVAELKADEARCKEWLDAHTQHARLIERGRAWPRRATTRRPRSSSTRPSTSSPTSSTTPTRRTRSPGRPRSTTSRSASPSTWRRRRRSSRGSPPGSGSRSGSSARSTPSWKRPATRSRRRRTPCAPSRGTDFNEDAQIPIAEAKRRSDEIAALYKDAHRIFVFIGVGVLFGIAFLVGVVGFVISYNVRAHQSSATVTVRQAEPDDPVPTIDFGPMETNAFEVVFPKLRAGTYPLRITSPNFEDYEKDIVLHKAENLRLEPVTLTPIAGFLRLENSQTTYSYSIRLTDHDHVAASGEVPGDDAVNLNLRPGRYDVTLSQGDRKFDAILDVAARQVTRYAPDFRFSRVHIGSQPDGAVVSIDGVNVGFTPFDTLLSPTEHAVSIQMEGFENYYIPVKPQGGAPLRFDTVLRKSGPAGTPRSRRTSRSPSRSRSRTRRSRRILRVC